MSWQARLLNLCLPRFERAWLAHVATPEILRRSFARKTRVFFAPPRGLVPVATFLGGREALRIGTPGDVTILHLHGGAFVFGSPQSHAGMLAALHRLTQLSVLLPQYRLAPEHPFPAAFEDALAVYDALTAKGNRVILGGDSAGGGLALALLAQITASGRRLPLLCYAMSPLADLTFSGGSILDNAGRDVMLPTNRIEQAREMYLQGADPRDPRASALFADFAGACPVALLVGRTEILRDDSLRLAEKLRAQGVVVHLRTVPDLPHVWPFFWRYLPEARRDLAWLAGMIAASITPPARATAES